MKTLLLALGLLVSCGTSKHKGGAGDGGGAGTSIASSTATATATSSVDSFAQYSSSDPTQAALSDDYVKTAMLSVQPGQTLSNMLGEAKDLILKYASCQDQPDGSERSCTLSKYGIDVAGNWHYYFTIDFAKDGSVLSIYDGIAKTLVTKTGTTKS